MNKGYLAGNVFVLSPHGWVSSLAAESHNRTWQLPEEMSPSTPSGDPTHEVWWCPLCCLRGRKHKLQLGGQAENHKLLSSSQWEQQKSTYRCYTAVCISKVCQRPCCLTSCLLHFFDAELGCGHCSRVMGWGIICKQEVATSENGANTMLCSFTNLRVKKWT